jgi:putative transcriptional regulator
MAKKKEIVTKDNFEELLVESVSQGLSHVRGETELTTYRVVLVKEPPKYSKTKIKKIRSNLNMSQSMFAKLFGESTSAIQQWEQGNRNMSKSARRLLNLLEKDHETIIDLMSDHKAS